MTSPPKPIFLKLFVPAIFFMVFGAILYLKSSKAKTEYETVKGSIDFIGSSFEELNPRDHRFIHIAGQDYVFDMFVGKETGDFSPEFEKLDELKTGDEITVYHSDDTPFQKNRDARLNKNVEFIDKDNQAYFIHGTKNKLGGMAFMGIGALFFILAIVLKVLKRIS